VTLNQVGANVTVSVTLSDANRFAQTGSLDMVLFAFNGAGVSTTDIVNISGTGVPAGVTLVAEGSPPGPFTGPSGDFGSFTFGIACNTDCSGASTTITALSFTVNNATIADLTAAFNPPTQALFVADVFIGANGATGVIDAVPGPTLGAGLPGLVTACL